MEVFLQVVDFGLQRRELVDNYLLVRLELLTHMIFHTLDELEQPPRRDSTVQM